jgi:ATPase subunit of ABC transporter with duplicated ATPase domains
MLLLQAVSFSHQQGEFLFKEINLSLSDREKIALVGRNGIGKSSLLEIIAGRNVPVSGVVQCNAKPLFLRQVTGVEDPRLVDEVLGVSAKRIALQRILNGSVEVADYEILDDDWDFENRCQEVLQQWDLNGLDLHRIMSTLSWGQQTRVALASVQLTQPSFLLLDEPSNHLDADGRKQLLQLIREYSGALILVSHDRQLLNSMDRICELHSDSLRSYGGNYSFYEDQKAIERNAIQADVSELEKAMRKAKEKERESRERQQKLDARGRRKQVQAGLPTISMNTLRNNAERSTAKLNEVHADKVESLRNEWKQRQQELPDLEQMRFALQRSQKPDNKLLFAAKSLQYKYGENDVWNEPVQIEIYSGQRIALSGKNGAGKSTLLKIICGELQPAEGELLKSNYSSLYLDQNYSVIDTQLTVSEQAQAFNVRNLERHEVNNQLNRFLFGKEFWDRSCGVLSGGEKMRLMLCCLNISSIAPDLIILDEPTNNLDLLNLEILEQAVAAYSGTLIVVSHDALFLERANVVDSIELG